MKVTPTALADVARQSGSAFGMADAGAGSLGAGSVTGEQHDAGSVIGKNFSNGLANAHAGAGNDDNFS